MKRLIAAIFITSIIIAGLWYISPKRKENNVAEVELYKCEKINISTSIYVTGNIENKEETAIYLSKAADVIDSYVKAGDSVCKGDLLFTAKTTEDYDNIINSSNLFEAVSNMSSNTKRNNITIDDEDGQYTVKSTFDGIVKTVNAQKGNTVGITMPSIIISSVDELQVSAKVPEEYIQDIKTGMDCTITGSAFKDKIFHGRIENIMPYATTSSILTGSQETTVAVIIAIEDADEDLKAGYTAKIRIETGEKDNIITVPYRAVGQDEDGNEYVMKYKNGIAEKVYITTGTELTDSVEILSGLLENDVIVLEPENISPNSMIKAKSNENN